MKILSKIHYYKDEKTLSFELISNERKVIGITFDIGGYQFCGPFWIWEENSWELSKSQQNDLELIIINGE